MSRPVDTRRIASAYYTRTESSPADSHEPRVNGRDVLMYRQERAGRLDLELGVVPRPVLSAAPFEGAVPARIADPPVSGVAGVDVLVVIIFPIDIPFPEIKDCHGRADSIVGNVMRYT